MAAPTLRGGLPLFSFKGIKVLVHWTFVLLPAWIIGSGLMEGRAVEQLLAEVGLVLIVFFCVVLHEFGHALTARRFGIRTRDITLLPIGGVASLERMPEEPRQEFWITIAGPLVNLVIAALALVVIAATGLSLFFSDVLLGATTWTSVLSFVFVANVSLFLFNLVPAFPMDGGRILRSLLSMRLPRDRATRIASMVGRVFAVAFIGYGVFFGQPFLALIGVFVYFAAGAEARNVEQQTRLRGITVGQVMRTRFWAMPQDTTVQGAVDELLRGGDHTVVVLQGGLPLGVLLREDLMNAVQAGTTTVPLASLPIRAVPAVQPGDSAHTSIQLLRTEGHALLPVISAGALVGVLEAENLAEFLQLLKAGGQRSA